MGEEAAMAAALNTRRAATRHRHVTPGRQGSRLQASPSTPICTRGFFSCTPSCRRTFTVIKSVIKAPFVCFVFHLRGVSVGAADCMYKEVHVFLCVHPYIVYAYHRARMRICMCAATLLRGPRNESSVSVFKQEVEDKATSEHVGGKSS